MYNRYIPQGTSYTRIVEEDGPHTGRASSTRKEEHRHPPPQDGEKKGGLTALLKHLKLDELDTGDILLLLILLLLFLEGDDMELVAILGLVLLLSLQKSEEGAPD